MSDHQHEGSERENPMVLNKWTKGKDGKWILQVRSPRPTEGGLDARYYQELKRSNFEPEDSLPPMAPPPPTRHPSSQKFHDLCDAMKLMHDKKQADYGRANDPFANVRASEDFGVAGWAGCMMRANDKMRRIQKAAQGGKLSNEGVEDSLMDLAVYSIIALVLYREQFAENIKVTMTVGAARMHDGPVGVEEPPK